MYAASVLKSMLGQTVTSTLPADLVPVDRVCQRWDVSVGTGLPTRMWDDRTKSKPPPLDDETAIIVDQMILRSPTKTRRILVKWYRTNQPDSVIARECNLTPRTLITGWHLSLNYLNWKLIETGWPVLLRILRPEY